MVDASVPHLRLGHHFPDHYERHSVVRKGRLLHRTLPLRCHDHLLHQRIDPEGCRSWPGSHVLAKAGQLAQANCMA